MTTDWTHIVIPPGEKKGIRFHLPPRFIARRMLCKTTSHDVVVLQVYVDTDHHLEVTLENRGTFTRALRMAFTDQYLN